MSSNEMFLAERLTGIGGSDCAALFSCGYGCERRLVLQKRQTQPDYPPEESAIMELGKILEPLAARKFEEQSNCKVETVGFLRHPDYPYLTVHVDRLIVPDGVLEIKCVGTSNFNKIKREGMPDDYVLQLQHGMLVTGRPWGAFAILNRDTGKLIYFAVSKDVELCADIIDHAALTWARVENGPLPDPLPPKDRRCQTCEYRTSCQGAALLALGGDEGDSVPFDDSLKSIVAEYAEAKEILEGAESMMDSVKERLSAAIGDRTVLDVPGARIYYRPVSTSRWNSKALEKDHPELAKDYKTTTVSRPLRVFAR